MFKIELYMLIKISCGGIGEWRLLLFVKQSGSKA